MLPKSMSIDTTVLQIPSAQHICAMLPKFMSIKKSQATYVTEIENMALFNIVVQLDQLVLAASTREDTDRHETCERENNMPSKCQHEKGLLQLLKYQTVKSQVFFNDYFLFLSLVNPGQ